MASIDDDSIQNNEKKPLIEKIDDEAEQKRKNRMLMISFAALVVVGLGNKVFQKLQTIPMYNYPYFLNLFTTFIYIPLSFAYVWPMMFWGKAITQEQRAIPWYKFAIMGCLDGIAGMMQSFAVNYIPSGGLIILLTQAAIPISMAISKPLLKAKYNLQHYLGAVIVVIGIVVVLIPTFTSKEQSGQGDESSGTILMWCGVLIVSCVPMTLSSVYKEKALGETEIDVVYLNGWVAVYQFIICLVLAVPGGYASSLEPYQIPQNFVDGAKCYIGDNSILESTATIVADQCKTAPIFVTMYLIFNVAYNILIIMILKYGSATLLFLAMTIMVPLGNFTFMLPFVPGHISLHATDIIGLIIIMIGLVIYRFWQVFIELYRKRMAARGKESRGF